MKLTPIKYIIFFVFTILIGCSTLEHRSSLIAKKKLPAIAIKATIKKIWETRIGEITQQNYANLQISTIKDSIYTVNFSGQLTAVNATTGNIIWQNNTNKIITAGPVIKNNQIFLATNDAKLLSLNSKNGNKLWQINSDSEILSAPGISTDMLFLHTLDDNVTSYDRKKGRKLWSYMSLDNSMVLRRASSPVTTKEQVFVGLGNGKLIALDINSGQLQWETTLGISNSTIDINSLVDISSTPVIKNNIIYAASVSNKLAALDKHSGYIKWSKNISSLSGLTLHGKSIYVADNNGIIWSLSQQTGDILWKQAALAGRSFTKPLIYNNYLIITDEDGYLYCLSKTDGSLTAYLKVDNKGFDTDPILWKDRIIMLGKTGILASYKILDIK